VDANELFRAGKLSEAIQAQTELVKTQPGNQELRPFLFELLCFDGQFDRADKQLDAIGKIDVEAEMAAQVYSNILQAERNRALLFSDGLPPEFLLDIPDYVSKHLGAIKHLSEKQPAQAQALIDEASQKWPELSGTNGGTAFEGFRDCDDILAPVFEFFLIRDYVWVPFEQIKELEISPPQRPRDLLWAPCRIITVDDKQLRGYAPILYPGSHKESDEQIKLGRVTDWRSVEGGPTTGIGHRVYLVGEEDKAALEVGELIFHVPTK